MLDMKWVREHPDELRQMLVNRKSKFSVDEFLKLDAERRKLMAELERLQAERNKSADQIGRLKAQKADATAALKEVESNKTQLKSLEGQLAELDPKFQDLLLRINNVPDASVPVGQSESDNKIMREVGKKTDLSFAPKNHQELGEGLGILDLKTGTKLSGARFAVLKGQGAALERALISFMLDVHTKEHGYTEVFAPYLVTPETMRGTGQLPKFEEDLFRLDRDSLYLIPTAEVSVTNMHRDDVLDEKDLPKKYVCYSACFRREAGSYGRDTMGLIRNHQFNKVELVQFAKPEASLETLELLTASAEKILYKLKIPYRVVLLCTADMGFASAKTYDLEVWMPGEVSEDGKGKGRWREISSCSTFTDFQARRMNIKYKKADGKKELVHTLNGSGLAVGRTFAAILENFQQADGSIQIPEALQPYTGFKTIPAR
jgi:seryl-tRNA synthetase